MVPVKTPSPVPSIIFVSEIVGFSFVCDQTKPLSITVEPRSSVTSPLRFIVVPDREALPVTIGSLFLFSFVY